MRILNAGCGSQTFGTHFIDISPKRADVLKCDLDKQVIPFPDDFFNIVLAENVMEHLRNPGNAIKEMIRVLKPGGELVIITDNASYLGYHCGSRTHYGAYEEKAEKGDCHYALYTSWHLKNHLNGMKGVRCKYMARAGQRSRNLLVLGFLFILGLFAEHLACPQVAIVGMKREGDHGNNKG